MIPTAEELILLGNDKQECPFRLGKIVSGKVQFDGEDTPSAKTYKRLGSYPLTNGDKVLLAAVAGTYVILGKVI